MLGFIIGELIGSMLVKSDKQPQIHEMDSLRFTRAMSRALAISRVSRTWATSDGWWGNTSCHNNTPAIFKNAVDVYEAYFNCLACCSIESRVDGMDDFLSVSPLVGLFDSKEVSVLIADFYEGFKPYWSPKKISLTFIEMLDSLYRTEKMSDVIDIYGETKNLCGGHCILEAAVNIILNANCFEDAVWAASRYDRSNLDDSATCTTVVATLAEYEFGIPDTIGNHFMERALLDPVVEEIKAYYMERRSRYGTHVPSFIEE